MSFEETQRFRHSKLWILLVIALIPVMFSVSASSHPLSGFISITVILICITLLYFAKLEVKVEDEHVSVRFFPVHFLKARKISKRDIESFQAEEYSPLKEFGGWGWRWFPFRNKTAYSVSGSECVRLTMENGTEIVIGSGKSQELEDAIADIK